MSFKDRIKQFGLFFKNRNKLFIIIFVPLLLLPLPILVKSQASNCAFVMMLMSIYWITEALPIPVTSLLPVVLLPMLGVLPSDKVAMGYFKDIVMLFFGGLVVANAIEITRLHERIALRVLICFGSDPKWLMLGFMLTTAFLSLWISNVAATSMMLPIVEAVAKQLIKNNKQYRYRHTSISGDPFEKQNTMRLQMPSRNTLTTATVSTELNEKEYEYKIPNESKELLNYGVEIDDCERVFRSDNSRNIMSAFLLSCSYAASIGGIGSLVGTAPNLLLKGYFDKNYPEAGLTFLTFMLYSLPIAIIMIFLSWIWLIVRWLPIKCGIKRNKKSKTDDSLKLLIKEKLDKLGPITWAENSVMVVFVTLILLWVTRDLHVVPGWNYFFKAKYVTDTTPAVIAVILLFILPKENIFAGHRYNHLIEWKTLQKNFPWDIILLCGGAFAMVDGFEVSGLSDWIGSRVKELVFSKKEVTLLFIILVSTVTTEFTSNTSIAAIFLPIIDTVAKESNINATYLLFSFVITACLAFMLPVATPTNAIIFATGHLKMIDMISTGIVMNVLKILVIFLASNTWLGLVFDVNSTHMHKTTTIENIMFLNNSNSNLTFH